MAGRTLVAIDRLSGDHERIVRADRRGIVVPPRQRLQVSRDRGEVAVGHLRRRIRDHLGHGTGRRRHAVMAGLQVGRDVTRGPAAEAGPGIVGDVGREPALQVRTAQIFAGLVAAQERLRCVAGTAMRGPLHQVGAPVPFGRPLRIGREFARREIERIPDPHRGADVERERQRVRDHLVLHRRDGLEVGADRQHVGARHLGVGGVRHGGIKPRAIGTNSPANGVVELVIGPRADAGVAIRRDVGRDDVAERRFDRAAAGKRLARIGNGMTGGAIGRDREIAAVLNLSECLAVGAVGDDGLHRHEQRHQRGRRAERDRWGCAYASTSGPGFFRY